MRAGTLAVAGLAGAVLIGAVVMTETDRPRGSLIRCFWEPGTNAFVRYDMGNGNNEQQATVNGNYKGNRVRPFRVTSGTARPGLRVWVRIQFKERIPNSANKSPYWECRIEAGHNTRDFHGNSLDMDAWAELPVT